VTAATPGLCPAGQPVGGFTAVTTGNTTNYTWSCNGSPVGGACAASHTPGVVVDGFDLIVRKFIGTNDAETAAAAVVTSTNASLTYQIVVTNV
jgi:hypothetical protein